MKCESCDHKEVCSKREAYKQVFDNLNKDVGEFEVELKCKHYRINSVLEQYKDILNKPNKILGAPWKDYPQPYIGDMIPNPIKIT